MTSPTVPATSPRDRLLVAARQVLADDGLEGLTLRAIARRAGVSHGAPLRHFPTLASLLAAVAAEGFDHLVAAVDAALAEAEAASAGRPLTATERLARAGDTYVGVAVADPAYQEAGSRSFGQLVDLVAAAQAEGWLPGPPPRTLAAVLWANVHGTAELLIHGALAHTLAPDELAAMRDTSHRLFFGATFPDPTPLPPQEEPA